MILIIRFIEQKELRESQCKQHRRRAIHKPRSNRQRNDQQAESDAEHDRACGIDTGDQSRRCLRDGATPPLVNLEICELSIAERRFEEETVNNWRIPLIPDCCCGNQN